MERELKYMVWDNVDYMSKPFTLMDIQSKNIEFTSDSIVLRYTGEKDKKGVEIYEDQIVKLDWRNIEVEEGKFGDLTEFKLVEYRDAGFWIGDVPLSIHIDSEVDNIPWAEVIGNVHEHPELLTESKNK